MLTNRQTMYYNKCNMKNERMKMTNKFTKQLQIEKQYCPACDLPMILVDHVEYDGDRGSSEPYHECVNKCDDVFDTQTEFGIVDSLSILGSFVL